MAAGSQPDQATANGKVEVAKPRKEAVLVFGATGRLGREVVTEVLLQHDLRS